MATVGLFILCIVVCLFNHNLEALGEEDGVGVDGGRVLPRNSSCYYYSIGLPLGEGQDDVPALLRHVAKSIEDLAEHGAVDVAGLMYSNDEVNEYGEWPRVTVFYTLD